MSLYNFITSMELKVLACDFHQLDSWWNFNHVHSPFSRLYYISEGEAYVTHDNTTFHLTPGTVHLIPCFTICDLHCPKSFSHYHISFTSRLPGGVDVLSLLETAHSYKGDQKIEDLFKRILFLNSERKLKELNPYKQLKEELKLSKDIFNNKNIAEIIETGGIIRILLAPLLKNIKDKKGNIDNEWLEDILTFIEANLNKELNLNVLSKKVGLHPTYFSDVFTKRTGIRPIKYIIKKRIDRAHILLLTTNKCIKEIADECGFQHVTYFNREFKKVFTLPPSKYRYSAVEK